MHGNARFHEIPVLPQDLQHYVLKPRSLSGTRRDPRAAGGHAIHPENWIIPAESGIRAGDRNPYRPGPLQNTVIDVLVGLAGAQTNTGA